MAKAAYVGVNGTPKKITNMYVGVNGTPKKVLKGYVGVNGVPKLFWDNSVPAIPDSWDYWTTVPNKELMHFGNITIRKDNYGKILYYGYFYYTGNAYNPAGYYPLAVSTESYACKIVGTSVPMVGVSIGGFPMTWYCWRCGINYSFQNPPTETELYLGEFDDLTTAFRSLVERIYAVPFHEDYQVNQYYSSIPACGDVRKTIRKIVGYQLAYNIARYNAVSIYDIGYKTYSDNIDDIIDEFMDDIQQYGNDNGMIIVDAYNSFWSGTAPLTVYHGHYKDNTWGDKINYLEDVTITQNLTPTDTFHDAGQEGFYAKALEFIWDFGNGDGPEVTDYYFDWGFMERMFCVYCDENDYETHGEEAGMGSQWGTYAAIGVWYEHTYITNLGIDL